MPENEQDLMIAVAQRLDEAALRKGRRVLEIRRAVQGGVPGADERLFAVEAGAVETILENRPETFGFQHEAVEIIPARPEEPEQHGGTDLSDESLGRRHFCHGPPAFLPVPVRIDARVGLDHEGKRVPLPGRRVSPAEPSRAEMRAGLPVFQTAHRGVVFVWGVGRVGIFGRVKAPVEQKAGINRACSAGICITCHGRS